MGEPGRRSSYSPDLRWRIVFQRKLKNMSYQQISENLTVSVSTVSRMIDRFDRTGEVQPSIWAPTERLLHPHEELVLLQAVLEKPSTYLRELQRMLDETTGREVSVSTICRTLHRFGFSRKKLNQVALQRSDSLRAQFQADIAEFDRSMMVFVDETGSDQRDAARKFGYSLRGYPAKSFKHLDRGHRVSAIAAMNSAEIICYKLCEGSVNGDVFYRFIQENLLPNLLPFDGYNVNSVVIMDNCSVHHVSEVLELLHSVGVFVIFLPPYSPDFNPIEECFSKVKIFLREHEAVYEAAEDPKQVIKAAFESITESDCRGWCYHAGY